MNTYIFIILKLILAFIIMAIPFANLILLLFPLFTFKKWRENYAIELNYLNYILLFIGSICCVICLFKVPYYSNLIENEGLWYLPILAPAIYTYYIRAFGYFGLFKSSAENLDFLYNRIVSILAIIFTLFFGYFSFAL